MFNNGHSDIIFPVICKGLRTYLLNALDNVKNSTDSDPEYVLLSIFYSHCRSNLIGSLQKKDSSLLLNIYLDNHSSPTC